MLITNTCCQLTLVSQVSQLVSQLGLGLVGVLVNVKDLEDLGKKIVFFNFDCGYVLTSCLLLYPQSFNIQLLIFRKLFIFSFFQKPGAVWIHCTFILSLFFPFLPLKHYLIYVEKLYNSLLIQFLSFHLLSIFSIYVYIGFWQSSAELVD